MENNININIVHTQSGFVVEELVFLQDEEAALRRRLREIDDEMEQVERLIEAAKVLIPNIEDALGANGALVTCVLEGRIKAFRDRLYALDAQHAECLEALDHNQLAQISVCGVWEGDEEGRKPQMRHRSKDWRRDNHDYDYDE